jgi:hypothetical protein
LDEPFGTVAPSVLPSILPSILPSVLPSFRSSFFLHSFRSSMASFEIVEFKMDGLALIDALLDIAGAGAAAGVLRVRNILDTMGAVGRRSLTAHLPNKELIKTPEYVTHKYPSALLSVLPKPNAYSLLGCIAEAMLGLTAAEITTEKLIKTAASYLPTLTPADTEKIRKSKTTQPFVDLLHTTRAKMDTCLRDEPVGMTTVGYDRVTGHPDYRTATQVFEVKLTGTLAKNWSYFVHQAFAYAALDDMITEVVIVLPLQAEIWRYDVSSWASRTKYRDTLNAAAKKALAPTAPTTLTAPSCTREMVETLCETYAIGYHAPKLRTLLTTVSQFPDPRKPYQIFLGSPTSSRMSIADADCAATATYIAAHGLNVFVHSPYIINLAATTEDDWNVTLLQKNLKCAAGIGCKGVVVHVGKSTTHTYASALETMRASIMRCLLVIRDCVYVLIPAMRLRAVMIHLPSSTLRGI